MSREFQYDIIALSIITTLLFIFAWIGVYITIAGVIYTWSITFVLSRALISAFRIGKQCGIREGGSAVTQAKVVNQASNQHTYVATSKKMVSQGSNGENAMPKEHLNLEEVCLKEKSWNPSQDF